MKAEMIWQFAAAALSAMGFSVMFQIRGKKLIFSSLGGGLCWVCYLAVVGTGLNTLVGYLAGSVFASLYAEAMARLLKAPATVFYVPSVIPLVPGGSLYYTMVAAMEQNWAEFSARGVDTLAFAAAIAGGILTVISLKSLVRALKKGKTKEPVR